MKLDELKRLDAEATPGPWRDTDYGVERVGVYGEIVEDPRMGEPDRALIAAARNALPALLAVAEAAEAIHVNHRDYGHVDESWYEALRARLAELEAQP